LVALENVATKFTDLESAQAYAAAAAAGIHAFIKQQQRLPENATIISYKVFEDDC